MRDLRVSWLFVLFLLVGCPDDTDDTGSTDVPADTTDVPSDDGETTDTGGDEGNDNGGTEDPDPGATESEDGHTEVGCSAYCAAVTAVCTGDNAQYASEAECLTYCADIGQLPIGAEGDTDVNTVGCRMYHAGVASADESAAAEHCPHAGATGANVCGSWCDNLCHLDQLLCTGPNANYDTAADCATACADYSTDGTIGTAAGNTVQCRLYHLGVAGTNPPSTAEVHCPHAGIDGAEQCVDAPDPTCESYCQTVQEACTGDNAQYADEAECIAHCSAYAAWPTGANGDTAGNTIGCRSYHAGVALQEDAALHCAHAGPSGGNVCGSWCEVYCDLSDKNCTGDDTLYDDDAACLAGCEGFSEEGAAGDAEGDTIQCRIYHLGVAGNDDGGGAGTHCPHGSADGGGVCSGEPDPVTCESYCELVTTGCTGENDQYPTAGYDECVAYCSSWAKLPLGEAADTSGNTVGCREYHAGVAADNPELHCAHAGPSGGGACGTYCENYCHLADTNCSGENALYGDGLECSTACEAISMDGAPGDAAGDSVQCRIYHLGVAGSDGDSSAAIHCPHGAPDGGGVCVAEVDPSNGDTCDAAIAVGALPYSYAGDTTGLSDDYGYSAGACPPEEGGWGASAPDQSFSFTPAADGWYLIGLSGKDSFDANLYVVGDCADIDNTCVAGDEDVGGAALETLTVNLTAGVTYYIIVDGYGASEAGTYTLEVSEYTLPDTPTCESYCTIITAACTGDNAQYADYGACVDYCATWAKLPLGAESDTAGNTVGCRTYHAGVASTVDAAVHCAHAGPSGGDVCGTWCDNYCQLALTNCADADALYADDAECSAACAAFPTTGLPGDTSGGSVQCKIYHLGVAGSDGGTSAATHCPHGAIDGGGVCSEPTPGDTCSDPIVVGALPYSATGDTSADGVANDYSYAAGECPGETTGWGAGSNDQAYAFTATNTASYTVSLTPGFDSNLYVVSDCADIGSTCLAADEQIGGTAAESVTVALDEGQVVYVIVDGWNNASDSSGPYTLTIFEVTEPQLTCDYYCTSVMTACTGDNAQYASMDACLDYCNVSGAILGGALEDTVGNTLGCRIYHAGVASTTEPDLHCAHAGPSGGNVCGTWCENYCSLASANCSGTNELFVDGDACAAACAAFPDTGAPGAVSGDNVQCKIYHLGVAGSDGETSAAVHCPHGGVDGGGVCVAGEGDTCSNPLVVDALPYAYEGDTSGYEADYGFGAGECPGEASGWGAGSSDVVFSFTPEATGAYTVSLTGASFDSALYVVSDCADIGGTCLGADDDVCTACTETLTLAGTAGETLFIIVDGYGNATNVNGAFTLNVEKIDDLGCQSYCTQVQSACTGANAQYTNVDACMSYCETWGQLPLGDLADTDGNTVGCRIYHAGVASISEENAAVHCPHAGPSGGNVCGTWCDNYCGLAALNCTGANELFADDTACGAGCSAFASDGSDGATVGDSVQCRIYHLGVAGSDGDTSAAVHCPHGAVDGGGVCVAPAIGETCLDPFAVDALPFTATGDTTGAQSNYGFGAGECAGEASGWGASSSDHVFAYTPDADGTIEVAVTGTAFDSVLYAATDCDDIAGTCLGADDDICSNCTESLQLDVTGGTTYYLIVDGYSNGTNVAGSYELNITAIDDLSCKAYCAAVQGACTGANSQYASAEECETYCETGAQLPLGDLADTDGNTVGCRIYHAGVAGISAENAAIHCPHAGPHGGSVCGDWCDNYCHLAQTNCSGANELFADAAACEAACGGYADSGEGGDTTGDTVQCRIYHLGVAGSDADTSAAIHCPHGGVDGGGVCVAAATGDTCDTPFTVDALPFVGAGDSSTFLSDYGYASGACPPETGGWGAGANDVAYAFTPDADIDVVISLDAAFDSNLYVVTDCGDVDGSCVGGDEDIGTSAVESLELSLTGGTTYFVIVDGWGNSSSQHGPYTLTITDGAPPEPLSCAAYCAAVQSACTGANSQYDSEGACLAYCAASAQLPLGDLADTEGNTVGCRIYHAGVAAVSGENAAIHCPHAGPHGGNVCGDWCENYCHLAQTNCSGANELYADDAACAAACAGLSDAGDGGDVDGDTVQCRIYHLGVAGTNGDTSAAAHCPHGAIDGGGVCVPPPPGDTCADPFTVDALPFSATGDTTGAANDYSYAAGECLPETGGWGAGSSDHAYAFTPDTDGTYEITLSGFDSNLYVVTDCADVGGSCVGGDEEVGGSATESLELELTGGTTYYIIVDGWNNGGNTAGSYTLTVEAAGAPAPTYADVQPIFQAHCGGCHTTSNNGGHNIGSSLASADVPSYYCPGKTKAECAIVRIKDGSMPLGGGTVPAADQDTIQAWVDAGTPE